MIRRWLVRVLVLATLGSVGLSSRHAVANEDRLAKLEVAFTARFASFVRWPQERVRSAMRVCPFGDASTQERFAALGRAASSRRVEVVTAEPETVAAQCDVVFIARGVDATVILANLAGAPVLTVSNAANFTEVGGIIRLYESGNRIRFEVSLPAAKRAGITISAKLLQLATVLR